MPQVPALANEVELGPALIAGGVRPGPSRRRKRLACLTFAWISAPTSVQRQRKGSPNRELVDRYPGMSDVLIDVEADDDLRARFEVELLRQSRL